MESRFGNIYEVAPIMEDVVFGTLLVAGAVSIFLLGYWLISWVVSKICGND